MKCSSICSYALLGLVLTSAACESQARSAFLVRLVDGQGVNPVPDVEANLTVTALQSGIGETTATARVRDGTFELDLPIAAYDLTTALSAEIEPVGDSSLIGATLAFAPIGFVETGEVHIVMGRPGTCTALTAPRLEGARLLPGLALVGVNLVNIGGERSGGTVRGVDVFSALNLSTDAYSGDVGDLSGDGMGRTRMAVIDGTVLLAIDDAQAIVYAAGNNATGVRDTSVTLYGGAGSLSAVTSLGSDGVAVVGGLNDADDAVAGIAIVRSAAAIDRGHSLAYPRSGASAQRFGRGILVAGGQADGEPLFEWISLDGGVDVTFGEGLPARSGGALVVSPGGASAFYYLGRANDGSLPSETYLITGCPAACSATLADPAEHPRADPAMAARVSATAVLGGYDLGFVPTATVEEVRFVGSSVSVVTLGDLASPRADTVAVSLGGGTVLLAGGQGPSGPLDTMELCFPEELEPLVVPDP